MNTWLRYVGLAALLGYAVFLARNSAVVAGGSDSSGYLNSARLLADGKFFTELRAPAEFGPRDKLEPMHFLPQGFWPATANTRLSPTYPTGLPLHLAAAGKLLGWRVGPDVVVLLAALGAVWLCYLVAREAGVSVPLAAAGATTLAAFPVFIFTSVQPLSDTLATTWTLAALFAALRARRSHGWALAAGGALAIAVLVRPTNLLITPALLVLLGFDLKKLGLFVLGGVPGALWLGFYNHTLYGGAGRSGYGDVFAAFAWSYGAPTAVHFAKWLALLLPAAVLALPVVAWRRRETRGRPLLALTLIFVPVTGFYAFYEVSHETWWCLRFILPAAAALIIAAMLGLETLTHGAEANPHPAAAKRRNLAALVIALWAIGTSWYWTPRLDVFLMKHYEQAYADGAQLAREKLPPNAVVMSFAFTGTFYYYSDFPVLRWDQLEAPAFTRYAELSRAAGRPVCSVIFDWEEKDAFRRCPGAWRRIGGVRNVGLWQLDPPNP